MQLIDTQQLGSLFHLALAHRHQVITAAAQGTVGDHHQMGVNALVPGPHHGAAHAKGFIIGVGGKHQPGAGWQG